jgi:hypothetical protein
MVHQIFHKFRMVTPEVLVTLKRVNVMRMSSAEEGHLELVGQSPLAMHRIRKKALREHEYRTYGRRHEYHRQSAQAYMEYVAIVEWQRLRLSSAQIRAR